MFMARAISYVSFRFQCSFDFGCPSDSSFFASGGSSGSRFIVFSHPGAGDLWMFCTCLVHDLWMMVHKVYTQNVWRRRWLSESRVLHRVTSSCRPRICETIEVAKCFSTVPMCESSLLSGVMRSLHDKQVPKRNNK